ncbi:hypothetical protein PRK78_003868 [Emydomyces testavorans]|uniref:VPS9 domain-containing protein n=1 Tax=Emydomyces testavorans TaxID=2070801 RepID=A0AAF0DK12_9EURO|nr:hypothetical protein PRK78_003868 [Emydomyces testavorans]
MAPQTSDHISAPSDRLSVEAEPDIFEKRNSTDLVDEMKEQDETRGQRAWDRLNDLPIEMISLTDRFVESLSARVYDTPPSIDKLSNLFQEFYIRASSHAETHISILASRTRRGISPSPGCSKSPNPSKFAFSSKSASQSGDKVGSGKAFAEQQMLTTTEVAERRRMRKLFQYKRQALEEAIERRACESVYDKIWRHRSTLDEVRDEKLRSKTAALAVVGFGLKDLGVDIEASEKEVIDSDDWLAAARQSLMRMNDVKFPLGKLQHLTAAHKAIVDSLTKILPSSSSADEILPTLIYALVTSPPEGTNVISNLLFIQRFRASNRIDGEAAYCLTNLEAAISFLENVDLTGSDEIRTSYSDSTACKSVSAKCSADHLQSKRADSSPVPSIIIGAAANKNRDVSPNSKASFLLKSSAEGSSQHRLSSILQPPAKALGAANDMVRNTADQGIKNISNTLDNSFKFLFGRLKEVQLGQGEASKDTIGIVPKTLDDARRLVNSPVGIPDDFPNEDEPARDNSIASSSSSPRPRLDDRLANLVVGRKPPSDRTVRRREDEGEINNPTSNKSSTFTPASSSPYTHSPAFSSMRSFSNTLNPLNHIPGMIRGLGRSSTEPNQTISLPSEELEKQSNSVKEKSLIAGVAPPIKKFMELEDAAQLTIADVPQLLEDYKRLASALNQLRST